MLVTFCTPLFNKHSDLILAISALQITGYSRCIGRTNSMLTIYMNT